MKLVFPLTALTFFLLLSYLTYPGEREETLKPVENQDFFFKDFTHGTIITGSWIDQDYVVAIEINSVKLDMKLVFEFIENNGSANVNRTPSDNRKPRHGKIHMFEESIEYPRNATCRAYETFKLGSPSLLTRVWDFTVTMVKQTWNKCYDITLTTANGVWNGITWVTEWICDKLTWLADRTWTGVGWLVDKVWNGFAWMAVKAWNRLTWMTELTWNSGAWMVDCVSNGLKWMAEWAWNSGAWMVDCFSNGLKWMAEWAWSGLAWVGKMFLPTGNYVTAAVLKFYYGYLDKHVKHVQALIAASTWQDVVYMLCAVIVVNFAVLAIYLLVKSTVNFIRRLWQARKDRIAAANLPPAPKKPIWRPKPKKKNRKNKNKW